MRFLTTLLILGCFGYGFYWLNNAHPELKNQALEMAHIGTTFHTLEARFTAAQIMEKERLGLLKKSDHQWDPSSLRFHPYLLMEVKFTTSNDQTQEGVVLWDLVDGEMVLDTKSWEKTHGFSDCINASADKYEYKILTTIAKNGGKIDRQSLMNSLNLEPSLFEKCLDRIRKKKLIVKHGNGYRIHLNRPVINVNPLTNIAGSLVIKSCKQIKRIKRRYSPKQIKKAAETAFGGDFAIRTAQDVFLPIYSIAVQNSDGSFHTTHWNALNGKQISRSNFIE